MDDFDWLTGTYWCVPPNSLLALEASNTASPVITQLVDQTVWRFDQCVNGYITGISATNIGGPQGWTYNLMIGSVTPDGGVRISFSSLGAADAPSTADQSFIIGDGVLVGRDRRSAKFVMQMASGTAGNSVTHWATMVPVMSGDPAWGALPGYPTIGVQSLTALFTPISFAEAPAFS